MDGDLGKSSDMLMLPSLLPDRRGNPTGCRHSWEQEHSFSGSQRQGTELSGPLV